MHEAHVWYVRVEDLGAKDLAGCEALLDDDERARLDGFVIEERRDEYLAARGLVRRVLSSYAGIAPERWRFATTGRGRPRATNVEAGSLDFNVAHAGGLVVCIVSAHHVVGVDVEHVTRGEELLELGSRAFSARELAAMGALDPVERPMRALASWTAKEAYAKAVGAGAAIPFARIDAFDAGWQIEHLRPTPDHVVATAVRADGDRRVRIRQRGAQTLLIVPP